MGFNNMQQCVSHFRLCSHLHVSKGTAASIENTCFVMRFRIQTALHFALPFVHICTFPNTRQSARKRTADCVAIHLHLRVSKVTAKGNTHHAMLFKNSWQRTSCLHYHFVCICVFPNARKTRKKMYAFPCVYKNMRQCAVRLQHHSFASARFQMHSNLQENSCFAMCFEKA